jgi:hypothetical protein
MQQVLLVVNSAVAIQLSGCTALLRASRMLHCAQFYAKQWMLVCAGTQSASVCKAFVCMNSYCKSGKLSHGSDTLILTHPLLVYHMLLFHVAACTGGSNRTVWAASIQPGLFYSKYAYYHILLPHSVHTLLSCCVVLALRARCV